MKWYPVIVVVFFSAQLAGAQSTQPADSAPLLPVTTPVPTGHPFDQLLDLTNPAGIWPVQRHVRDPNVGAKPVTLVERSLPTAADLDRVRREVNTLLESLDATPPLESSEILGRLEGFAKQCEVLVDRLTSRPDRLEASSMGLQIYQMLAHRTNDRQVVPQVWIGRLNALARKTMKIGGPAGQRLGDFWALQVDMWEMVRAQVDLAVRQRHAIEQLERFLDRHAQGQHPANLDADPEMDPVAMAMLRDAKLVLLALYDQYGMSPEACDLVAELRASLHRDDEDWRTYLDRVFGYCSILGQRFDASLPLEDGDWWCSQDHRGRAVLLHVWSRGATVSPQDVYALQRIDARYSHLGLAVLSVNVDQFTDRRKPPLYGDWPICWQPPDQQRLTDLFRLTWLPRFVLIDRQGRVAAVGGSPNVVDQLESLWDGVDHTGG